MRIFKVALVLAALSASTFAQETTGARFTQAIKSVDRHGTQTKAQASDGTGAVGKFPKYNADGSLTDSGITAGSAGSSPLTTKGDLYTFSTVDTRLPIGTNGQFLWSDSTQTTGNGWHTLVSGDIPAIPESGVTSLVTDLAGKVPTSRTISTTLPLTGGGDLSADRTFAINAFTGDTGTGGLKGAVPAPAAGDAAAGKFLKADGTFAVPAGTSSGTVTSVAVTVPSRQSVSGSPITSSGTIAITDNSQNANTIYAGPSSGSAGATGFRTAVESDLPVPSFTTLTDSSAVTWDTGNHRMSNAVLTMVHTTATRSLTLTNLTAGASGVVIIKQDSTGGAAVTFGASPVSLVIGGGGGAVTVTSTANAVTVLAWIYDGTNLLWTIGLHYT